MPKVQIRAYGGTGSLILRAFYRIMMLDPIQTNGYSIELIHLDLDDASPDYTIIGTENARYQTVHNMKVPGFATTDITLKTDDLKKLRRDAILGPDSGSDSFDYSLRNMYGAANQKVMSILQTAFSQTDIEHTNKEGCFASLARNSLMATIMMKEGAFSKLNAGLSDGDIVIYVGSMDGGTANTFIEKDAASLRKNCPNVLCYSVRTLVYKSFPKCGLDGDEYTRKIDNLLMQTIGVLKRMNENQNALMVSDGNNIKSFYMTKKAYQDNGQAPNTDYLFDAVFLTGIGHMNSLTQLSQTTKTYCEAGNDRGGQDHTVHITELSAAFMIASIIAAGKPSRSKWESSGFIGNSGSGTAPDGNNAQKSPFNALYESGQGVSASFKTKWMRTIELYSVLKYQLCEHLQYVQDGQKNPSRWKEFITDKRHPDNKRLAYIYRLLSPQNVTLVSGGIQEKIKEFYRSIEGVIELLINVSYQMDISNLNISADTLKNLLKELNPKDTAVIRYIYDVTNHVRVMKEDADYKDFNQKFANNIPIKDTWYSSDKDNATARVKKLYDWGKKYAVQLLDVNLPDAQRSQAAAALIQLVYELLEMK